MAKATAISAAPSTSSVYPNRQVTVTRVAPNGHVISSNAVWASSINFDNESAVPGLGFDYVHLAAISGNFRNNPPTNFSRGARREHNFVTPIFFGGYPYFFDSSDYQQVQQQPQVIVIQQPAPVAVVQQATPAPQESTDLRNDAAVSATLPAAPAPVHDVGEFILVRRDGRVLFAAAYSVIGAELRYITPEGIRRTLPLAELDADATREMNEARGTTLLLHN